MRKIGALTHRRKTWAKKQATARLRGVKKTAMIRLAIYDMDRTITRAPTFTSFLLHAARWRQPWRLMLLPLVGVTVALYGMRLIDRAQLKVWNQSLLVGRSIHPDDLAPIAESFAEKTLHRNVLTDAKAQIAADHAEGYRLIMATASYRLYAEAIARKLGFDATVATNTLAGLDTRIMAKIDGENCYGPAKLRMVTAWMHDAGIAREGAHIRFYSDHVSDAPAMDWADEAFAVNAHGPLRKLAKSRGWAILDWD
jgi:HAD superfamily phosphoserine phosphatase-like hydrolase